MGERIIAWRYLPVGLAVASVWLAVLVSSVFAPLLITGSNHEQFAIAAMGDWLWGGLATGLLLLAAAFIRRGPESAWPVIAGVVIAIWATVGLASLLAPSIVTGTDPTTIPWAAMLAPIAGVVGTAFASVFAAGAGSRDVD